MVEANYRTQMSIADYARTLCVSTERLRIACVRSAGSAPLALLNARRLLEAKRSLLYTNMSVALVAESLRFRGSRLLLAVLHAQHRHVAAVIPTQELNRFYRERPRALTGQISRSVSPVTT